jgi:hypothetical protein
MRFLTTERLQQLDNAETASFAAPIPTQIVSSDEYPPAPLPHLELVQLEASCLRAIQPSLPIRHSATHSASNSRHAGALSCNDVARQAV